MCRHLLPCKPAVSIFRQYDRGRNMNENETMKAGETRGLITAIIERIGDVLLVIASLALFAMMLAMFTDAMGRKFIGAVPGAFETCSALLVLVMFLSLASAQRHGRHIAIDVITRFMPRRVQDILCAIGALLGSASFFLLAWLSLAEAWRATQVDEVWSGIIDYPVWPFRWVVPVGSAALALQFLLTAVQRLRSK